MASSIIASTIDDTYPVAGQDNDSQGFRDNFNIIKTNFDAAKTEIEELQDNTAKTNTDNIFFENTISRANFNEVTKSTANAKATVLDTAAPDPVLWEDGAYRIITVSSNSATVANVSYTFRGWPTEEGRYAEMIFQVYGDGTGAGTTLTFNPQYGSGIASTKYTDGNAAWTGAAINVPTATSTSILVKAFTYNAGVDVFLQYLGEYTAV